MLIKYTFDEVPVDQTNCNCCMKFGYVPEISPSRPTRRRLGLHCTCYHSELCTKGLAYHSIFPFLQKSILCSYGLTHSERSDENKLNKRMIYNISLFPSNFGPLSLNIKCWLRSPVCEMSLCLKCWNSSIFYPSCQLGPSETNFFLKSMIFWCRRSSIGIFSALLCLLYLCSR